MPCLRHISNQRVHKRHEEINKGGCLKLFTFSELSAEAQKRAIRHYQSEFPLDDISDQRAYDDLMYDLPHDRYNETGELLISECN